MSKARTRRVRRQTRARQRNKAAAPRHVSKGGRTGSVHKKKTRPKKHVRYVGEPARSVKNAARSPKCGALPGEIHRHAS